MVIRSQANYATGSYHGEGAVGLRFSREMWSLARVFHSVCVAMSSVALQVIIGKSHICKK